MGRRLCHAILKIERVAGKVCAALPVACRLLSVCRWESFCRLLSANMLLKNQPHQGNEEASHM